MAAADCLNKATILADANDTNGAKCSACNGRGKIDITIVMQGFPPFVQPRSSILDSIICINCNGKGTQNRDDMIDGFIWCKCDPRTVGESDSFEADDGEAIFGNVTYLCRKCHMVVQFG